MHDGSYMPEVAKDVCSAAYMIYCTHTQQRAKWTVVDRGPSAGNYRGKIMGGLMVQLVLKAATQGQVAYYQPLRIDCDNMGVVQHGNTANRPLCEKQIQADVLRISNILLRRVLS